MYKLNIEECNSIREILVSLKEKSKDLNLDEEIYNIIPLNMMCKRKILIPALVFHPITQRVKLFYEDKEQISNLIELKELLFEIINFEISCDLSETILNGSELKQIIKEYKRLVAFEKREIKKQVII